MDRGKVYARVLDEDGNELSSLTVALQKQYVFLRENASFLEGVMQGYWSLLQVAEGRQPVTFLESGLRDFTKKRIEAENRLEDFKYVSLENSALDDSILELLPKEKIPVPEDSLNFAEPYLEALFTCEKNSGFIGVLSNASGTDNKEEIKEKWSQARENWASLSGQAKAFNIYSVRNGNVSETEANDTAKELVEKIANNNLQQEKLRTIAKLQFGDEKSVANGKPLADYFAQPLGDLNEAKMRWQGLLTGLNKARGIVAAYVKANAQERAGENYNGR